MAGTIPLGECANKRNVMDLEKRIQELDGQVGKLSQALELEKMRNENHSLRLEMERIRHQHQESQLTSLKQELESCKKQKEDLMREIGDTIRGFIFLIVIAYIAYLYFR